MAKSVAAVDDRPVPRVVALGELRSEPEVERGHRVPREHSQRLELHGGEVTYLEIKDAESADRETVVRL